MKNNLDQEEAIQIVKDYLKRLAETYEDKEYAAEIIERIYNEDTTCEDIDFILECKKLKQVYYFPKRDNFNNIFR